MIYGIPYYPTSIHLWSIFLLEKKPPGKLHLGSWYGSPQAAQTEVAATGKGPSSRDVPGELSGKRFKKRLFSTHGQ